MVMRSDDLKPSPPPDSMYVRRHGAKLEDPKSKHPYVRQTLDRYEQSFLTVLQYAVEPYWIYAVQLDDRLIYVQMRGGNLEGLHDQHLEGVRHTLLANVECIRELEILEAKPRYTLETVVRCLETLAPRLERYVLNATLSGVHNGPEILKWVEDTLAAQTSQMVG
jgi:hypothetical protein